MPLPVILKRLENLLRVFVSVLFKCCDSDGLIPLAAAAPAPYIGPALRFVASRRACMGIWREELTTFGFLAEELPSSDGWELWAAEEFSAVLFLRMSLIDWREPELDLACSSTSWIAVTIDENSC